MDFLYTAAGLKFSAGIVERMKAMDLNQNDLMDLKREDINSEFDDLNFVHRKKLWVFFEEQQKSCGGRTFNDNTVPPMQKNLAANRRGEASHAVQPPADPRPPVAPPPYSPSPDPRRDSSRGGTTNVDVGQATRSNVAGRNITSTTYNTPQNAEYGSPPSEQRSAGRILRSNSASRRDEATPPKKNKYDIKLDGAQGVAIGDSSKVQGNKFNSRN